MYSDQFIFTFAICCLRSTGTRKAIVVIKYLHECYTPRITRCQYGLSVLTRSMLDLKDGYRRKEKGVALKSETLREGFLLLLQRFGQAGTDFFEEGALVREVFRPVGGI